MAASALDSHSRQLSPRVRVFIDRLAKEFASRAPESTVLPGP